MKSCIKFNRGIMKLPPVWQLWIMVLLANNLVAPFFFLKHPEAWLVIGALMASMLFMTLLTKLTGFSRLVGLGHVFWIPLLAFLWIRLGQIPPGDPFGIWIRVLMTVNVISLIIDASDVVRYIKGDRAETVSGLDGQRLY